MGNPWGWLGLLLIPAIVVIHCLQRQQQPLVISTLFLVQRGAVERRGGRKFVFWKHSVTFWLQILAAMLITWLLLQPRWIGEQSVQQVAYVLDSSLSMEAFRERMLSELEASTRDFEKAAAKTNWLLMESNERAALLYRGPDRESLLRAAEAWQPGLGTHDWTSAVGTARALTGPEAAVVYVSDHLSPVRPHQMGLLAVGEATDNVGFTGVQVGLSADGMAWQTILKNYSDAPVSRTWWLEIEGERSEPRQAELPANGSLALGGIIPRGVKKMALVLEDDAWGIDNRLPIVRPEPKGIAYRIDMPSDEEAKPLRTVMKAFEETFYGTLNGQTDILIAESPGLRHLESEVPNQILFATLDAEAKLPDGYISREDNALNKGLNWNGLAVRGGTVSYTLGPGEAPLVWMGSTPLVWLREHPEGTDLIFNFSPSQSNALKLPATVLLMERFTEQVRAQKAAYQATNVELGETLIVNVPAGSRGLKVNGASVANAPQLTLEAPERPGFIEVSDGQDKSLLLAGSHFADVREAELRHAASDNGLADIVHGLKLMNSEEDAFQIWWLLLLCGVMLASWHYAERGR